MKHFFLYDPVGQSNLYLLSVFYYRTALLFAQEV